MRLEDKLSREIAARTDKENALERRLQEIDLLKEKLRNSGAETREVSRISKTSGKAAGIALRNVSPPRGDATEVVELAEAKQGGSAAISERIAASPELSALADEVHNRARALSDRLLKAGSDVHDEALRDELAVIAATMVALTAKAEGKNSPILPILSGAQSASSAGRESLAARASAAIGLAHEAAG